MIKFATLKALCDFIMEEAKTGNRDLIIEKNDDGETCLYEKVLVGKVVANDDE